jgi:hypothetical protein
LPRFLFGEADLLAKIPAEERFYGLSVNQAMVHPENPHELLLQARRGYGNEGDASQTPSYLFKVMLSADLAAVEQIELLRMDSFTARLGYSPDGRFIFIGEYGYSTPETTWYLLDQETGQTRGPITTQGHNLAWSPDGQWFVQDIENYLLLNAPDYDYQYFIPHGFDSCSQVVLSVDE